MIPVYENLSQYKKINPYVGEIKYRKFSQDTYKQESSGRAGFRASAGHLPDKQFLASVFENKIDPAPQPH